MYKHSAFCACNTCDHHRRLAARDYRNSKLPSEDCSGAFADYPPVVRPILKLILRQMAYFLFLMLMIAFGLAVLHG